MSVSLQAARGNPKIRAMMFVAGVVVLFISGRAAIKMYNKYQAASEALDETKAQYESMRKRNDYLATQLEALATPEGLEAEIRRKFSVAKEGEEVIILVDPEQGKKKIQPLSDEPTWLGKIWRSINPFD
jgi:cell division protein FtsB